ncbi:choline ABC transporter substrate-binding protein [Burkholderia sp. BCC1972]|uniref:choline ABC transporter substrate-binding protein n=1 Tax=Burkholderia sp. BCC1972 TaxID=2817438 RepID=UPI002ABDFC6E|nr:choline ABC transporter substrate-binding protein [Burkholderia sp. BCC1972]
MRKILAVVVFILTGMTASCFAAQDAAECKAVRLGETSWADNAATTGIAMSVLQAVGYAPVKSLVSSPIAFSSMQSDHLDVFLGDWSPTLDASVNPLLAQGKLYQVPTPNLTGAKYTLAVPTYAAEQGLRSFQDISRFKEQLDGKIYGIESSASGNQSIKNMIKKNLYGLGDFTLVESSEAGMLVEVTRAIAKKKPIVFLGWAPHPMNLNFKMTYLSGGDEVFGPDYGAAKVYTLTSKDYSVRCPNAARLVSNLKFAPDMESELMVGIADKKDPVELAKGWIQKNPKYLDSWLQGVTTFDGKDATSAARLYYGIR